MREKLDEAMGRVARTLITREDMDCAQRVERGLDAQGNPLINDREFLQLKDSDGSGRVWRIRVRNGALEVNELPT